MTVVSVLQARPDSSFSPTMQYSLWSDEVTAEDVAMQLSLADYRRLLNQRPRSYRLKLDVTGTWASRKAPPAAKPAPVDVRPARAPARPWAAGLRSALEKGETAKVLELGPLATKEASSDAELMNNLAWTIARPDGKFAAKIPEEPRLLWLAKEAGSMAVQASDWKNPEHLNTLARCHWIAGDKAMAIRIQQIAVSVATKDIKGALEETLASYRAGR